MCVVFLSSGVGSGFHRSDLMSRTGAGIWAGFFFVIPGVIAILVTRPTVGLVSCQTGPSWIYGLSVFNCILAAAMLAFGAFSVATNGIYSRRYDYQSGQYESELSIREAFLPLRIVSLLIYAIEFILFIITAGCGCCQQKTKVRRTDAGCCELWHNNEYLLLT